MFPSLKNPLSLTNILNELVVDDECVPFLVKEECIALFHEKKYRRCFDNIFKWRESVSKYHSNELIYLPGGMKSKIVQSIVNTQIKKSKSMVLAWKHSIQYSTPYFEDEVNRSCLDSEDVQQKEKHL